MTGKQNIVIVGGGGAAIHIAKELSKKVDASRFAVTIVTERPYHIHMPGTLRMLVTADGGLEKRVFTPYDRLFAAGKPGDVVIGKVTRVEDGSVTLANGRVIQYDYLVLATGTLWKGPIDFPADLDKSTLWIAKWRKKFQQAKSIVLLGGGAVGVELSGEIRHFLPDKRVTIVHNDIYLLNSTYPEKFRKFGTDRVRREGVNLVLGDRAELPTQSGYTSITTEKGVKIETDLVVPTVGGKLNTEFLRSFDSSILTKNGALRVGKTLQVQLASGKGNVYAVGDIIDWDEQKQLAKTAAHGSVVITNILAATNGLAPTAQYKGSMEAIAMPLGPKKGFGYIPILWGIIIGDWLTWLLKSRTLFIDMARKGLGYSS